MPYLRTFLESSSGSHLTRQGSHLSEEDEVGNLKRKNSMLKQKLDQLTLAFDVQLQKQQATPDIIKQKDSQILYLKQQLDQHNNSHDSKKNSFIPHGYDRMLELQAKLKDSEERNMELTNEIRHLERIQQDQGKALERLTDETEYPQRINAMLEEIRVVKERNRQLELKLRQEIARGKQQTEQIVRLEETIRELKQIGKRQSVIGASKNEVNKPYHVSSKH